MMRWIIAPVLAAAAFACTHTKEAEKAPPPPHKAPAQPAGAVGAAGERGAPQKQAPERRAALALHRSYDRVTAAAQLPMPPEGPQPLVLGASEYSRLLAQAKSFYTRAEGYFNQGDYPKATSLALAAGQLAEGLSDLALAERPLPGDVPAPPAMDEARIREQLDRNAAHRKEVKTAARPPASAPFAKPAETIYNEASRALEAGSLLRAERLAQAAEDLTRADGFLLRSQGVQVGKARDRVPPPPAP